MKALRLVAMIAACGFTVPAVAAEAAAPRTVERAYLAPLASHAPLVAASWAGSRIVAAGDYGVVLLSDDQGRNWRQARDVQATTLITDLAFTDAQHGWATAHGGLLLATSDGGEHWQVAQRFGPEITPMSVAFDGRGGGVIVGTYGFAMRTDDGGQTWVRTTMDGGDIPDRHLNDVFATGPDAFVIAAEAGAIFRSSDGGATWSRDDLPIMGSLWTGKVLRDGSLLVAGMGGRLFRWADGEWHEQDTGTDESLTSIAELSDRNVVAVGLAGTVVVSQDGGHTFREVPRSDRSAYAATVAAGSGEVLVFGATGVAAVDIRK